jgi:hypothetical protein
MKSRNLKSAAVAALLIGGLFSFASASANAATYDWTASGTYAGSGVITTDNAPAPNAGSIGQDITGITGTFDGLTITALHFGGDNILYPSNFGSDGFGPLKGALDALGLDFVAGGNAINIFFAGSTGYDVEGGIPFTRTEEFVVSEATATPLPSTWMMMLGGLAGLGFFALRKAKDRSTGFVVS